MPDPLDRKTRRLLLLAAAIDQVLQDDAASTEGAEQVPWSTTGHPHRRAWAWNPRRGPSAWRLAGRLQQHRGSAPDGT